ncbi:MAG: WxcM-like domain-containing protein [Bacteroidales bacterium]|nr:WxcM-like domain-containing protein [Bacteroidales bacterium]
MSSRIIALPKILDDRGNLSFLENGHQIPFEIKRVHWIFDVPGGESRGAVAYKQTEEFIVAMSGSFDVWVDDGKTCEKYHLNRSYEGVYVPRGTWRKIDNFSTNSLAAIATSTLYDPADAIRDYDEFLVWTKNLTGKPSHAGNTDFPEEDFSLRASGGFSPMLQDESSAAQQVSTEEIPAFGVHDCEILSFDRHHSARKGDICVVENARTVPFDIKRLYYLYDVPADAVRGGHAHKRLYQLLIAASGSFTVRLDDGKEQRSVSLKRPYQALLIKPGIWREVDDFSSGSVCMVLASELYDESDYIRNYQAFIEYKQREL